MALDSMTLRPERSLRFRFYCSLERGVHSTDSPPPDMEGSSAEFKKTEDFIVLLFVWTRRSL